MILHIGENTSVDSREIVSILNLADNESPVTRDLLGDAEEQHRLLEVSGLTAKSAVICAGARKPGGVTENTRVYLSPISSMTLMKRMYSQSNEAIGEAYGVQSKKMLSIIRKITGQTTVG